MIVALKQESVLYSQGVAFAHTRSRGVMTVRKLIGGVTVILCACALLVAGCESFGTATGATWDSGTPGAAGLYPVSVGSKWGIAQRN